MISRLLVDLGAHCSRLRRQTSQPGDWPASAAFHRYFDDLVDTAIYP
jgi:hypothetical protein